MTTYKYQRSRLCTAEDSEEAFANDVEEWLGKIVDIRELSSLQSPCRIA